jgi:hypothetical protein
MNPDTKSELRGLAKTGGVIALGAALVTGVTLYTLPDPPPVINLAWDCANYQEQAFQFIRATNIAGPWEVYAVVTGTNRVSFPRTQPQEFFTIGATWLTTDTNQVLRWDRR